MAPLAKPMGSSTGSGLVQVHGAEKSQVGYFIHLTSIELQAKGRRESVVQRRRGHGDST